MKFVLSFAIGGKPTGLQPGDFIVFDDGKRTIEFVRDGVKLDIVEYPSGRATTNLHAEAAVNFPDVNFPKHLLAVKLISLLTGRSVESLEIKEGRAVYLVRPHVIV
jgi:hypothetical protein